MRNKTLAMFQAAYAAIVIRNAVDRLQHGENAEALEMLKVALDNLQEQDAIACGEIGQNLDAFEKNAEWFGARYPGAPAERAMAQFTEALDNALHAMKLEDRK